MASPLGLGFSQNDEGIPSFGDKSKKYRIINNRAVKSLFGNGQFSPFPASINDQGNVSRIKSVSDVHNDAIYDVSIGRIIEYSRNYPSMRLDYSDFVYLKDIGVFPNNRLMIARRFPSGIGNDLTSTKATPMSTLISWAKDGEDYFSMEYGEEWDDSEGSYTEVLNDMGEELILSSDNKGGKAGSALAGGIGLIPLPGLFEGIQYELFKKLGISDLDASNTPLGNPNLIRKAKRRSTVEKNKAGSGLMAKFQVKMVVEYEQKFINGVDPTLVYLDIIQNALTFGTSDSKFQFNSNFGQGTSKFIQDLVQGNLSSITRAVKLFVKSLIEVIKSSVDLIKSFIKTDTSTDTLQEKEKIDAEKKANDDSQSIINNIVGAINKTVEKTLGSVVAKYKIRLLGVTNALTGGPSTPWHITIGNPMRPIFSSGDMLCEGVTLTLGKSLSFNDLPSYIKLEFTLSNARPLGGQEIFNRFNTGKGRSYVRFNKSYVETNDSQNPSENSQRKKVDPNQPDPRGAIPKTTIVKNEVTPTQTFKVEDEYLENWDDSGVDFNNSQTPSNVDNFKIGDQTKEPIKNSTGLQESKQNRSDAGVAKANMIRKPIVVKKSEIDPITGELDEWDEIEGYYWAPEE